MSATDRIASIAARPRSASEQPDEARDWRWRGRQRVFDLNDLLGVERPAPPDWLIEPYVARGRHTILAGGPGSGKTMLLNQLAAHAMAPSPDEFPFDLGIPSTAKRVVWFDGEMGQYGTQERYWDVELRPYIDSDRFVYVDAAGLDIARPDDAAWFAGVIREVGADLAIFDSLRKVSPGADENSSQDMTQVVGTLSGLAHAENGPAVVTIHHLGKDRTAYRGSSAILDQCDSMVGLLKDEHVAGLRRLTARGPWTKVRYGREPDDIWLQMTDTGLFVPADEPITGPVSKWDPIIAALLPWDGTKASFAEACGTHGQNKAWTTAYTRNAMPVDGGKQHISKVHDEPAI